MSSRKVFGNHENHLFHTPSDIADKSSSASSSTLARPQPNKTAFMCFSNAREGEFRERMDSSTSKKDIFQMVAEEWKRLSNEERHYWSEVAREDKVRFEREKAAYQGKWEAPKRRAKKDPFAPKRPMSAFLGYSQKIRKKVKAENPDMENTDVSRLLGEMWRNASPQEKHPFLEREREERAWYKDAMSTFKAEQVQKDAASRLSHSFVMENDENVVNHQARNRVLYARTPSSKHVEAPCIVSPPPAVVPTHAPHHTNSPHDDEYNPPDNRRDYHSMGSHPKEESPYSGYHYPPNRATYPLDEPQPRDRHSQREEYSPNHVGNHSSPPSYYSSRDYNDTYHAPNGFYSRYN